MKHNVHLDKRIRNEVYARFFNDKTRTQILFGGSSSGKSVAAAQRCVIDVANGGRNYMCVRHVKNTIKTSIINEIVKAIDRFNMSHLFDLNKSDFVITCVNGYQILFVGLDDVAKVKSITPEIGVITDILIEEATEIEPDDYKQLKKRLRGKCGVRKRILFLFNPIFIDHWIYVMFFKNWDDTKTYYNDGKLSILKTTYLDNLRFLEQDDIDSLEDETDKYYHDVYTLGNWGVIGNVIFKNWEVRDLRAEMVTVRENEQVPLISIFDNFKNGIDFGFSSDPAALSRSHYDKNHKTIYITDEIYMREMTNDVLGRETLEMIGQEYVKCDSAEPKSIEDLRRMNVRALAARKGKDSVNHGIDWLQRQHIVIDVRCQNTKNEMQQYKWKEDKDGMVLKVPVDKNNHLIDALRYAYEDEMEERQLKALKPFM